MSDSGSWTAIDVAGKPCDVFQPAMPSPHGYCVIFLHAVQMDRLVDKPAFTAEFERRGLRVIAPLTRRSWWADRISPEFDAHLTAERHVLDNILGYVRDNWSAAPPRIALLGISMGGQGALRLAFKHPNTFPIAAAISPAIDYQMRWNDDEMLQRMYADPEQARQDTATLHVHPLNWPRNIWFCCDPSDRWHESCDRLRMKLNALGVPHECDLETSAGGHSFEYFNHMAPRAMGFIADRLERERLRVT